MSQHIDTRRTTHTEETDVSITVVYSDAADARLKLTTAYQAALQQLIPLAGGQPKTQTFELPSD